MITENSRRFVVTQFENCGFPNCSGALSLRLRAIALALRGAPTVQQFRHRRRSFLEAARCCAYASRTAATDETESPPRKFGVCPRISSDVIIGPGTYL